MLSDFAISDDPDPIEREGTIVQLLAGALFKVKLSNCHVVLARLSGKLRKGFIKLVPGDRVRMEMSPDDSTKAQIILRI